MTKSKPKKPLKKSKKKSTLLPLLLTVFLFVLALLGVMMLSKRTELDSQAAKQKMPSEDFQSTHTYQLMQGYNVVTIPGQSRVNAESICKNSQYITNIYFLNSENSEYVEYNCENPVIANFFLKQHEGYVIKVEGFITEELTVRYTPTSQKLDYTQPVDLIGLNYRTANGFTAEEVCEDFRKAGKPFTTINRWYAGSWDGHRCGVPVNNFGIDQHGGYYIQQNQGNIQTLNSL